MLLQARASKNHTAVQYTHSNYTLKSSSPGNILSHTAIQTSARFPERNATVTSGRSIGSQTESVSKKVRYGCSLVGIGMHRLRLDH